MSNPQPYLCLVTKINRELLDKAEQHRLGKEMLSMEMEISWKRKLQRLHKIMYAGKPVRGGRLQS